jgi:hypothetical protein
MDKTAAGYVRTSDGSYVLPGGPGAAEEAKARFKRQQAEGVAREAHRREVRKREEAAYQAEQTRKREAAEAERRETALAATAEKRAEVERECRVRGVPDHQIKTVVDAAMLDYHKQQASDVATQGARTDRELRDYFLSRPTPACPD